MSLTSDRPIRRPCLGLLASVLICQFVAPLLWARAEDTLDQLAILRYTSADGMPSDTVRAIAQTPDGYLWIATNRGLARFDGVRFITFDVANTSALSSDFLTHLAVTPDGRLWIGGNGGLVTYRDGVFSRDGLPRDEVQALHVEGNRLWVATSEGALFAEGGALTPLELPEALVRPSGIAGDGDGGVWIADARNGLFHLTGGGTRHITTADGLPQNLLVELFRAADGTLWLGTQNRGMARLEDGVLTVFDTSSGLPGNRVRTFCEDRDGWLWIGTNSGLCRFRDGHFERFTRAKPLGDNRVRALFLSAEGLLWAGAYGGGLARLATGPVTIWDIDGQLTYAVAEDGRGGLLTTTPNGLYRLVDGRWEGPLASTAGQLTFGIFTDADGSFWIGSLTGLVHLSADTYRVLDPRPGLPEPGVRFAFRDPEGTLWAAGWIHGAARAVDDRFEGVPALDGYRLQNTVISPDNVLLLGTDRGLFAWREDRPVLLDEGLAETGIRALHYDEAGVLWIATLGKGLLCLRDGAVTAFTTRDGLFVNLNYAIIEREGRFWLSSEQGLWSVRKEALFAGSEDRAAQLELIALGQGDGLRSLEHNGTAPPFGLEDRQGQMWFPHMKGLVSLDPDRIRAQPSTTVTIEAVRLDGQAVPFRTGLEVPAGTDELHIDYTAVCYQHPETLRFRYRLDPFDTDWHRVGQRRAAIYTGLPPGRYRFRVESALGARAWGEPVSLSVSARAFWWETHWFRVAVLLVTGLLLWWLYRMRMSEIRRNNRRLEEEIEERRNAQKALTESLARTAEINTELNQRRQQLFHMARVTTMGELTAAIAHELNQPLTAIATNAFFLERQEARDHLEPDELREVIGEIAEDTHRAAEIITGMRAMLERKQHHHAEFDLAELIWSVEPIAHSDALAAGVDLVLDLGRNLPRVRGDAVQLQQLLLNLILNGCDACASRPEHEREVVVRTAQRDGEVLISVTDSGPPVPDDVFERMFEPFYTTKETGLGMGMAISRSIAEAHNGTLEAARNPEGGMTVTLTLPPNH